MWPSNKCGFISGRQQTIIIWYMCVSYVTLTQLNGILGSYSYWFCSYHQELMRSIELTLPGRCLHNPNILLNNFYIRKVLPCYLKPYIDFMWWQKTVIEEFQESLCSTKLTANLCHHQRYPKKIRIWQTLCHLHKYKNDVCLNFKCHNVIWIVIQLSFMLLQWLINSWHHTTTYHYMN